MSILFSRLLQSGLPCSVARCILFLSCSSVRASISVCVPKHGQHDILQCIWHTDSSTKASVYICIWGETEHLPVDFGWDLHESLMASIKPTKLASGSWITVQHSKNVVFLTGTTNVFLIYYNRLQFKLKWEDNSMFTVNLTVNLIKTQQKLLKTIKIQYH